MGEDVVVGPETPAQVALELGADALVTVQQVQGRFTPEGA